MFFTVLVLSLFRKCVLSSDKSGHVEELVASCGLCLCVMHPGRRETSVSAFGLALMPWVAIFPFLLRGNRYVAVLIHQTVKFVQTICCYS